MPTVTVTQCIDAAALMAYDPARTRIRSVNWLEIFNQAQMDLAARTKCLEAEQTCAVTANESRSPYPDDLIVVKDVWFTTTPSDPNTYRPLEEKFRDEWKAQRWGGRSYGTPTNYFARPGFIEMMPGPDTTIVAVTVGSQDYGPLWYTYAKKATRVLSEQGATIEVPDWLEQSLEEGMVARAKIALREPDGLTQLRLWQEGLVEVRASVEDRSDDRRPAFRTPGMEDPFAGMS